MAADDDDAEVRSSEPSAGPVEEKAPPARDVKGKGKQQGTWERIQTSAHMLGRSLTQAEPTASSLHSVHGKVLSADAPGETSRASASNSKPWTRQTSGVQTQSFRTQQHRNADPNLIFEPPEQMKIVQTRNGDRVSRRFEVGSIEAQEDADGAAVVRALIDPESQSQEHSLLDQGSPEIDIMTPGEADRLRAALFNGDTQHQASWSSLLNFLPSFLRDTAASATADRVAIFGRHDMTAVESAWLIQWESVLASYTDDVWGSLDELVSTATHEVRRAQEQLTLGRIEPPIEMRALGRLSMLLAHIKGSAPVQHHAQQE